MDTTQMHKKARGMEKMAGEEYGKGAEPGGLPRVATHTASESMVMTSAASRPAKPPATAPLVVQPFHSTERIRAGKLAEAAMAKVSDTMKATFCFSNTMPRNMAMMPRATVVSLEILSSSLELALPFLSAEA